MQSDKTNLAGKPGVFKRTPSREAATDQDAQNATLLVDLYDQVHCEFLKHLPEKPCRILQIGSGSGRDGAKMAELGHSVVVVEPSDELRRRAQKIHCNPNIRWFKDTLPKLKCVRQLGVRYDVIVLSSVWIQVAQTERRSVFRRVTSLLNPGGVIYLTIRHTTHDSKVDLDTEVGSLARDHGLIKTAQVETDDALGRDAVTWTQFILKSPGDGTGALPLLRGIILNERKSSTYKLGLLKVLQHIAQSASGMAEVEDEQKVVIPLGLFGLYWLRVYRPLLDENLPQLPGNKAAVFGVGFASKAYEKLAAVSPHDLRPGMRFSADVSGHLHTAIKDICRTLVKMPMTYITYSDGKERVFVPTADLSKRVTGSLVLDKPYLFSFGRVEISADLWQSMLQYGSWIEPAIVAEWKVLMKKYLSKQSREQEFSIEKMEVALSWKEPERGTQLSRQRAIELIESGSFRNCVWSGKTINTKNFDIDHCFPYAAWPCGDMWNLLPASRQVNQNQKRDKLPTAELLMKSEDLILNWWQKAYVDKSIESCSEFFTQASASLRIAMFDDVDLENVFSSLVFQQQNLRFNQQIPEWEF